MKRFVKVLSGALAFGMTALMLCSCAAEKQDTGWKDKGFDLSLPKLG